MTEGKTSFSATRNTFKIWVHPYSFSCALGAMSLKQCEIPRQQKAAGEEILHGENHEGLQPSSAFVNASFTIAKTFPGNRVLHEDRLHWILE
jgi:hypothetical protein